MCWINDTGERPVQIAGMSKDTIMDGFVHPFKAVCSLSPNGDIGQEIRGGKLGNVIMTIKKAMSRPAKGTASCKLSGLP